MQRGGFRQIASRLAMLVVKLYSANLYYGEHFTKYMAWYALSFK